MLHDAAVGDPPDFEQAAVGADINGGKQAGVVHGESRKCGNGAQLSTSEPVHDPAPNGTVGDKTWRIRMTQYAIKECHCHGTDI
ncbi:hypothetical protein D3C78_1851480 [compost metagenome]